MSDKGTTAKTISIWGAPSAGKTTFIIAMRYAARKAGYRIYDNSPSPAVKALLRGWDVDIEQGKFPPATKRSLTEERLSFGFEDDKRRVINIEIPEASGEEWLAASHSTDVLRESIGVICLIDPTLALRARDVGVPTLSSTLGAMLSDLRTKREGQAGLLSVPVALCLTKMDRPEHSAHIDDPARYVKRVAFDVEDRFISNYVQTERWRWFACSAVGFINRRGYTLSNSWFDDVEKKFKITDHAHMKPVGVIEPLMWILNSV